MLGPAIMVAALVVSLGAQDSRLRCPWKGPTLPGEDVKAIGAAVGRYSRFPVVDVELPDTSEHAPARTLEAYTLTWGTCHGGGGDTFWVRKGSGGWRVLKKAGHWARAK